MLPHFNANATLRTQRSGILLCIGGRTYRSVGLPKPLIKSNKLACYWKCTEEQCKGTATSRRDTIDSADTEPKERLPHTCEPDPNNIINRKARNHFLDLIAMGANRNAAYEQTWDDLNNPNFVPPEYIETNGRDSFASQKSYSGDQEHEW